MAYDESLAERIRDALDRTAGVVEKKMFGGLCFMLYGNILVGVWKDSLIARIGPEAKSSALEQPHVREFDITGKPMKGWIVVEPEGIEEDEPLKDWIQKAIDFVGELPKK
jgi:hypothetical protein